MNKPSKEEVDAEIFALREFNLNQDWVVGFKVGATHEHETQVIPLREQIRDWEKRYNDATERNIDLRERLEKVEKALKEARDVLVMASLIDKTSTCMDAVNEIDQLLTKEG